MMKTLRTLSLLALLPVLVSCGGGGDSGCATGLGVLGGAICGSSSPNTAPVANAGVTQNVRVASLVTLDGSGSRDENNDTLTYLWEMTAKPTGSVAALSSNTSAKPQFTADLAGTYTITLVVDDGKVKSPVSSATVVASVTNSAPVANAGVNQNVSIGRFVTLDGTASTDANSDTLSYKWTLLGKPTGSAAVLSSTSSPNPTFTADVVGIFSFGLVVNDGKVDSTMVSVTVVASSANSAPVANAGVAQSVITGTVVTLDGTGSTDANNDPLTYKWSWGTRPTGSMAALSSETTSKPTFTASTAGTYVLTLVVNDGKSNSDVAAVTVTASVANAAPVANAGTNQNVTVPVTVTLDGSASSDANRDPLTYSWTLVSRPTSSTAALSSSTSAKPTFSADIPGVYVASLVVNDGALSSPVTTTTITAAAANSAPVANAGVAQNVTTGSVVTLDGSASTDANRDPLTYSWTLVSRPTSSTAALSSSTSAKPTFSADVSGVYVVSLVVNDGALSSPVTTTTITAAPANSAPVANAGVAQNVTTGSVVTLDGSASTDANRDVLTYAWALVSRPTSSTAALSSSASAKPTFSADVSGVYVVSLVVNDGALSSPVTTTTITAAPANSAPVANAGVAQNVTTGSVVTLTGAGSTDANGDTLSYIWSFASRPTSSTAALSATSAVSPTFTADLAGTYVVNLLVNDGKVNSSNVSAVTVTASAANSTPVANAGVNQTVARTSTVTLTGAGSTDANGDTLTYLWALTTRPTSSTASLSSTTVVSPTFVADIAGIYVATLIVNDGKVSSTVATVAITVN